MSDILYKIDRRGQEDLVNQLRSLILKYCPEWKDTSELESDEEVDALIRIFSNMAGNVIESINQAPDKNFVTFLNLIGISPTPPRVAKAPLVFKLKDDIQKNSFILAGSKVSAQTENGKEVIFETEKDLTVIPSKLVRAISIDPTEDRWSDMGFILSDEQTGRQEEIFRGEDQILHRLYLGHSQLFSYKEKAKIQLSINMKESGKELPQVKWYYFDENGDSKALEVLDSSNGLRAFTSGSITFTNVKGISSKTISGYDKSRTFRNWTNNWIYAELKTQLKDEAVMPDIEDILINMDISISPKDGFYPDSAFCNVSKLDMTKDFYPLNDKPDFHDTFYIASAEAFSKENAQVTITVALSSEKIHPTPKTKDVTLSWEYWDGNKWSSIMDTSNTKTSDKDTSNAFTKDGTITFKCPNIKVCNVNGEDNYWIRVRITEGDYGKDGYYEYTSQSIPVQNTTINVTNVTYHEPTYEAPSFESITVNYTHIIEELPEIVLTENNFTFVNCTEECLTKQKYFKPFLTCSEEKPTFYLAFDSDISSTPISILFPLSGEQKGDRPIVAWEYWNGAKWLALSVNDAIKHFTRREILQFTVPEDAEKRPLYGSEYYWIRAQLESGGYTVQPKLGAIYSNAVWAYNSNSIAEEILGSSNGEPEQTFKLSHTPVLEGQKLRVLEIQGKGEWIDWKEVNTFSLSGTDGRDYVLDRENGKIVFGDGKNGMVPPAGVDNIKCDYQYGGGDIGNVAAGLISQMWDNNSDIDSVMNPIAADGGFDQEDFEQAKIRGPHTLKSWNRGVTCEDIEWLVREAMPQIAKVKCLATMDSDLNFTPGKATVIVVPENDAARPVPSQELLNEIDSYLSQRASAVIGDGEDERIDVIGPDYIPVGIEATVEYTSRESSKIIEGKIIDNLKRFFDPIRGGDEGAGWDLGRNLYISEVYSVIKNTAGVDYVTDLSVKASVQCFTLTLERLKDGPYRPLVTYPKYSMVRSNDNRIILALAGTLQAGTGVKSLPVKAFGKNNKIKLLYRDYKARELNIISVNGDVLECETADGEPLNHDYPAGSDIEAKITKDLTIRSYILNQVKGNPETFFIKIAVPKSGDIFFLSRNDEYANTTPLKVLKVKSEDIFLDEDELICSGTHLINKNSGLQFPYLLDSEMKTIHDLSNIQTECAIDKISDEDKVYLAKTSEAPEAHECTYCFTKDE